MCYNCSLSSRAFIHTDYEGYLGGKKAYIPTAWIHQNLDWN